MGHEPAKKTITLLQLSPLAHHQQHGLPIPVSTGSRFPQTFLDGDQPRHCFPASASEVFTVGGRCIRGASG